MFDFCFLPSIRIMYNVLSVVGFVAPEKVQPETESSKFSKRPEQNARRFGDDVFKSVSSSFVFQISLMFVPNCPIANRLALFQVMTWHRTGNKPLPVLMITRFSGT